MGEAAEVGGCGVVECEVASVVDVGFHALESQLDSDDLRRRTDAEEVVVVVKEILGVGADLGDLMRCSALRRLQFFPLAFLAPSHLLHDLVDEDI